MSMMLGNCPHCDQELEIPTKMQGQTIQCPTCKQDVELPSPVPASPPTTRRIGSQQTRPKKRVVTRRRQTTSPTRSCPYCGEAILRAARKCKHCGEFLAGKRPVETNVKQGALIGATVCLVIGLVLMVISLWSFFLYSPLFFAAFVLSIVAMAQRRVVGGLVVLLITLIVPPALFFGLGAVRGEKAVEQITEALDETVVEFEKQTAEKQRVTIVNNLKMIDAAKEMWALETGTPTADNVDKSDIVPYIPGGFPTGPDGARYEIGGLSRTPVCYYRGRRYTAND